MGQQLQQLREELASIDRQILRQISLRQEVSAQIGMAKRKAGQATRDFSQEKEVLQRARAYAEEFHLPPGLADELFELLIRQSLTRQEQQNVEHQGGGEGRRVLVIGGAGQMGRWIVRFLGSQGFLVEVADPADPHARFSDWRDSNLDQDFIVVAAPLGSTREILQELARRRPAGLVFDIGSLKSVLRQPLQELVDAGVRVTSVHPMFGPDTELLSGRHIIFVDVGMSDATREVKKLFESTMAELVEMDLEDHDRLMAYVLGLSHALNIAFFTALAESGETAGKLAHISSTTFNAQLSVSNSVAADNPHLYFEIQSLNDYGTESLTALLYAVERLRSVVRARDEDGFVSLMKRGRHYLSIRQAGRVSGGDESAQ